MGYADVWNKTLVYFGIAEEEDWDEDGYLTDEELQRSYAERPNVRRLTPRRARRDYDDWTDPEPAGAPTVAIRPDPPRIRPRAVQQQPTPMVAAVPSVRVHLVLPRSFNDAQ